MPPRKKPVATKIILEEDPEDRSPKRAGRGKKKVSAEEAEDIAKICGGYTKIQEFGKGAYGEVWKAQKGKQSYAVKISKPKKVGGVKMMDFSFIKEIDFLTRLRHPNVMLSKAEVFISKDQVCYFMPIMSKDLSKVIATSETFDLRDKIAMFFKCLCGLAYLHANFVIHCDIKPENILYNPDTKEILLTDYGLSVIFGSSGKVKYAGSVFSAWWRPPEFYAIEAQSEGYIKGPDAYYFGPEVDIYAMGWVGMELLFKIHPPCTGDAPPLAVYEYLRSIGCSAGPLFSQSYGGLFDRRVEIAELPHQVSKIDCYQRGDELVMGKVKASYFKDFYADEQFHPDHQYIFDSLVEMIRSPPLQRPTARELVNSYPSFYYGDCKEITISYPAFREIKFSAKYTPIIRKKAIDVMSKFINERLDDIGIVNLDSVKLQAIDLLDRIFMVMPPGDQNSFTLNAAVASFIALALLTSWGTDAEVVIRRFGLDASEFSDRVVNVIYALKSKLYRPTLDQITGMTTKEALEILDKELSPREVSSVSSEELVSERASEVVPEAPKVSWVNPLTWSWS